MPNDRKKQWEYVTERIPLANLTANYLDTYGEDGWELVNVHVWDEDTMHPGANLIFKREVMTHDVICAGPEAPPMPSDRNQPAPEQGGETARLTLDRYCEHCGYTTNIAACMSCGRPTKQLHPAAQGRDDLYVCPHGSMAPFPCTGGDSVKLQPAPAAGGAGGGAGAVTPERIEEWVRNDPKAWAVYQHTRALNAAEINALRTQLAEMERDAVEARENAEGWKVEARYKLEALKAAEAESARRSAALRRVEEGVKALRAECHKHNGDFPTPRAQGYTAACDAVLALFTDSNTR